MKQFQKIAIGLLGLTNPEMFIPRSQPATKIEPGRSRGPRERRQPREGRGPRALRALKFMLTALAVGSRTVPLADNTELRRDLRDRARLLYGTDEG
jgi:hypothetical protein